MRKCVFVLAVIAASSSMALAGEVKQTKIVAPVVKTMSDAQMDKVTAGDAGGIPNLGHDSGMALGGASARRVIPAGPLRTAMVVSVSDRRGQRTAPETALGDSRAS